MCQCLSCHEIYTIHLSIEMSAVVCDARHLDWFCNLFSCHSAIFRMFNTFRTGRAYKCLWIGHRPIFRPIMTCCQLDLWEYSSVIFFYIPVSKHKAFPHRFANKVQWFFSMYWSRNTKLFLIENILNCSNPRPSLVRIVACHQFNAKPLTGLTCDNKLYKPMMTHFTDSHMSHPPSMDDQNRWWLRSSPQIFVLNVEMKTKIVAPQMKMSLVYIYMSYYFTSIYILWLYFRLRRHWIKTGSLELIHWIFHRMLGVITREHNSDI